ncbi:MAG TPA: trigger factor [Phycisphaerae bacterium]|nr:trigger factor [Phycisphaerae bacterium]HNU44931.1 trigger factor [Phycisphaerae bacterium]
MADEELAAEGTEGSGTEAQGAEPELSEEDKLRARLKEAVSVTKEDIGPLRLKLTVTVPRDLMDERLTEQFRELKREAQIPGFRKGRAPLRLVEKRFGTDVGTELADQLVHASFSVATEKEELRTVGDALVWVSAPEKRLDEKGIERTVHVEKLLPMDEAVEHIDFPKEGPLTYACEVEIAPQFELPALDNIPLTRPQVEITDQDVDAEVDRLRRYRATYQPVDDGMVEADDLLYTSVKWTVEGQLLRQEESTDLPARDLRLFGVPLKGLGAAVCGKRVGDEVALEATVPDDHQNTEIRGKPARFEFKLQEIKRLHVPPLDADLLNAAGFENEGELRSFYRSRMESERGRLVKRALREQAMQYLIEHIPMEVPQAMSQRQADRIILRRMMEMYRNQVPEAEIRKAGDEMRVKAQTESERDVKAYFIMEKLAERLDVDVSEDELNGAIHAIAQQQNRRFDRVRDDLAKQKALVPLFLQLRDEKALDRLIEKATISEGTANT